MKPDWKDAPEWANWLTMDNGGSWYWWAVQPVKMSGMWVNNIGDSLYQYAGGISWQDSLESRPNSP